jgi:hypothetical protein
MNVYFTAVALTLLGIFLSACNSHTTSNTAQAASKRDKDRHDSDRGYEL